MIVTGRGTGPAERVLRAIVGDGGTDEDGSARGARRATGIGSRRSAGRAEGVAEGGAPGVVEDTRPARAVAAKVAATGGADAETALLLGRLTGKHLGGDPRLWRALHDALGGHRGTLPALLAELPPTGATEAAPDSGVLRAPAPRSVHDTLGMLLEHTDPGHAAVALAALPERAVAYLLEGGTQPARSLVDAVVDHGDSRVRAALARHPRLDSRVLARLLAVGDPQVAAAVYRNPRATPSLRRTVAHRLDTVPLDETLRAELTAPRGDVPRTWLAPLLGSGDPSLVAAALRSGVRQVAEQYALLRVWERCGPSAVRALLAAGAVSGPVAAVVGEALSGVGADDAGRADQDGRARSAARELRARCEPYEDPARLPELLATARGTSTLRDLLSEPYAHDLDALTAAHGATPFMPKACEELARHEAASDAQRRVFRLSVLNEPWRAGGRRAGNSDSPAERLAREPLDDSAARWAEGMAAAGLLDAAELVHTARPAVHAVAALARLAERNLVAEECATALLTLTETHLGDHPHAWAALDTALPEHPGTLAELIAEAGRVRADAGAVEVEGEPPEAGAEAGRVRRDAGAVEAGAPEVRAEAGDTQAGGSHGGDTHGPGSRAPGTAQADTRADGECRSVPGPRPSDAPSRPPMPRRDRSLALSALDLLYSLAPTGAPLPDDPDVLRALSTYDGADAPGLATPDWFADACESHSVPASEDGYAYAPPTLAAIRERPPSTQGNSARLTEQSYAQGVLPAEELLTLLPAHRLLLLPHDWRRLAFAHAWRAALARRLRAELGTDPDAWLRLAATATRAALSGDTAPADGPSWAELLRLARTPGHGSASGTAAPPAGAAVPAGTAVPRDRGPFPDTARPRTPDEAIALLARGNHLWAWPEGTLLCLADPEVVDAVLPRLGPDGPWLLAAYLLREVTTPRHVLDRLLDGRDPAALRVLAEQCRWLDDGSAARLADLDDPDIDLVLLRRLHHGPSVRRIVSRSRPDPGSGQPSLGARVLAAWRADGSAGPAGGRVWLCSAEPDLIEEILTAEGSRLGLGHQLLGCLRLLEHGGPDRLARIAGRDLLGRAATTVCAKALASDSPASVLRARLDRELAPAKLVVKLRRATYAHQTLSVMGSLPPGEAVDWAALEAAHAAEPLPYWGDVVTSADVPDEVRLRHAALLPEPGAVGLPGDAALTRERAGHGLGTQYHCAPTTQLDGLLTAGLLSGADLLHLAAPAARMLAFLNAADRRTDAPPQAGAARTELAALVRERLGTDPAAWARVADRLTGRDPRWDPLSTVAALLGS
ncbi:hypothetical protein ACFYVL_36685 [Streptomyces sp. NPDC004111]|uniref:hypothetical protein n=1 Tax=Streptomyces sp. NPDC004111 TaxID=3364690 RepID=UPI0036B54FC9